LMYLDDGTSGRSVTGEEAIKADLPWTKSHRTIDLDAANAAIEKNLVALEELAQQTGFAVGTGYAYPATIEEITRWAKSLEEKGIVLVPISAKALDD